MGRDPEMHLRLRQDGWADTPEIDPFRTGPRRAARDRVRNRGCRRRRTHATADTGGARPSPAPGRSQGDPARPALKRFGTRLGYAERTMTKKLMNSADAFVDEMLDGLSAAHPSLVREGPGDRVIRAAHAPQQGKVGIVSGGGSGHLPLFTGYVGRGLLLLFGNYGGDKMNFSLASEMLELEDIRTATVLGNDDIASAAPAEKDKRRG